MAFIMAEDEKSKINRLVQLGVVTGYKFNTEDIILLKEQMQESVELSDEALETVAGGNAMLIVFN